MSGDPTTSRNENKNVVAFLRLISRNGLLYNDIPQQEGNL